MRITLIIHALTSGGAERVLTVMANYWAVKGEQVTILTFADGSANSFYALDERIEHRPLDLKVDSMNVWNGTINNLKRVWALRSAIRQSQPQIVISFLDTTNVLTLLATIFQKFPVIVNENIHPAMHRVGKIWGFLRRRMYPRADRVVTVTNRALSFFSTQIQSRGRVIPNPALDMSHYPLLKSKILHSPALVAMGRLDHQKGFDVLLKAFAALYRSYPQWSLTILGEGPLRAELELLRDTLQLKNQVHLLGAVKNPQDYLHQAEIFVMSSRYEGFPNALCEAMAAGCAVISTDCLCGPREIIRDGVDGILVAPENVDQLAKAMEQLMRNEAERQRLAARAPEVTARYGLKKIMQMWQDEIEQVLVEIKI